MKFNPHRILAGIPTKVAFMLQHAKPVVQGGPLLGHHGNRRAFTQRRFTLVALLPAFFDAGRCECLRRIEAAERRRSPQ